MDNKCGGGCGERMAVVETTLKLIHGDVRELKDLHREALVFRGQLTGIKWILGVAWVAIASLCTWVLMIKAK